MAQLAEEPKLENLSNSNMRAFLVGENISDLELRSKLNTLLESKENDRDMNFDEFINSMNEFKEKEDFSDYGITDSSKISEIKKSANKLIEDFESNPITRVYEENQKNFRMTASEVRSAICSLVYKPEEYGKEWGFRVVQEVNKGDLQEKFKTLQTLSQKFAKERVYAEYTWGKVIQLVTQSQSFPEAFLSEIAKYDDSISFDTVNQSFIAEKVKLEAKKSQGSFSEEDKERLKFIFTFTGRLFGTARKQIETSDEFQTNIANCSKLIIDSFQNGYEVAFGMQAHEYEDDNVLTAEEKLKYIAEMGKFREKENKVRVLWSTADKGDLVDEMEYRILAAEGRYLGERFVGFKEMKRWKTNPFGRVIPKPNHKLARPKAFPPEEVGENSDLIDYLYLSAGEMALFPEPTGEVVENLNRTIQNCLELGKELILFVPTCPCDQHALSSKEKKKGKEIQHKDESTTDSEVQIKFTGGPIIEGISWTGQNTIDGLSVLIPKLLEIGVNLKLIFATGDMEWTSGNTREMADEQEYYEVLSKNHPMILNHMLRRLGIQTEISKENSEKRNVAKFFAISDKLSVEVDGIMELANNKEISTKDWQTRRLQAKNVYSEFKTQEESAKIIGKVLASREDYYKDARNAHDWDGNGNYIGSTLWHLDQDIVDYIAFHQMSLDLYQEGNTGVGNMILFAGDSRPLELLASEVVNTFYMNVQGNYEGAALKV